MRLSKIQKFLKANNINYELIINKYGNNEFADINIKDEKTNCKAISEISGNRGNTVAGILVFFKQPNNRTISITFSSQTEIIKRLENDIKNKKE